MEYGEIQFVKGANLIGQEIAPCRNGNNAENDRLNKAKAARGEIKMGILTGEELTAETEIGSVESGNRKNINIRSINNETDKGKWKKSAYICVEMPTNNSR